MGNHFGFVGYGGRGINGVCGVWGDSHVIKKN